MGLGFSPWGLGFRVYGMEYWAPVLVPVLGVSQNWGYPFGGPSNKDYSIWGSILQSLI